MLVRGDTNATLSGARAAAAAGVPLVHVEAGLRSRRADMPEEHNRMQTDRLADLLLAPTPGARRNLRDEGLAGEVHVTGDPLCDTLESWRARVKPAGGDYVLATVHRNYNTDSPERLQAVLACLARSPWPVLLPMHPRTRARIAEWELELSPWIRVLGPCDYPRMLSLERGAQAIATDSGGVQREAYLWGVPCITLREETEWTDTVDTGWNTLVGCDPDAFQEAFARPAPGRAASDLRRWARRAARSPRRRGAVHRQTGVHGRWRRMTQLRVGLIGAGKMGSFHMESWERIPAARLVAVADPDEAAARGTSGGGRSSAFATTACCWSARMSTPCASARPPSSTRRSRSMRSPPVSTCSWRSRSPPRWRMACAWPRPRAPRA